MTAIFDAYGPAAADACNWAMVGALALGVGLLHTIRRARMRRTEADGGHGGHFYAPMEHH